MYSEFLMVKKIRGGDERACEWLVEKYYAPIYQYCLLHTRDRYYAEDLAQETFLKFFASVKDYTFCGKTKNYLYTIAGNLVRNYYKKKKEVPVDVAQRELSWQEVAKGGGAAQGIGACRGTDMELRMDIERAVGSMPEELREAAVLYFFQELKQKEIAALLGIKLSLVKYRVSRAKKILAEYLEVGEE